MRHGRAINSKQDAIRWAMRCPAKQNEVIEIRQVQAIEDFPPEVRRAVGA